MNIKLCGSNKSLPLARCSRFLLTGVAAKVAILGLCGVPLLIFSASLSTDYPEPEEKKQ